MLDIRINGFVAMKNNKLNKEEFEEYTNNQKQLVELHKDIANIEANIDLIKDATANEILRNPEKEIEIKAIYYPRLIHFENKKSEKVYIYTVYIHMTLGL